MSLLKRVVRAGLQRSGFDIRRVSVEETPRLSYVAKELRTIEESVSGSTTQAEVLQRLRALSVSDFGAFLFSLPDAVFPRISALLPRMASEEVQVSWTGTSGVPLLMQTLDFVRSVSYNFAKLTGRSLDGATILDYGCGYGRISRLMYYFTEEDKVFGVDPWEKSIQICHADGLTGNFSLSDYLPVTLPVVAGIFDLIFAFSVFTHLSEKATVVCLNTIGNYVRPDGVVAITIRPVEYWDVDKNATQGGVAGWQKTIHLEQGFSFLPHDRPAVDGDVTYGDTSMELGWLSKTFPQFEIAGVDRSLSDPYQLYVFLRKR